MAVKKGLNITRECWQVLRENPSLFLFPLFSTIALTTLIGLMLSAGFLIPAVGNWVTKLFDQNRPNLWLNRIIGIAVVILFYLVSWFIVIFFNSALVGCALMHFKGEKPTIGAGVGIALGRLPQIFAWSIVNGIVGVILKSIEEQLGLLGAVMIKILGLSWIVATYFVTPVLVVEGTGPWKSLRRSVGLLQQTWGEALTGNFVIQGMSWLGGLLVFVVTIGGIVLAIAFESIAIAVVAGASLVLSLALLALYTNAMTQVFLAGMYQYASTGQVPAGFSEESMRHALRSVR